jgi:hypothetical protein
VIRVDNYWCHSAILSTRPKGVPLQVQKPVLIEESSPSPDPVSASGPARGAPVRAFSPVDTPTSTENAHIRSITDSNKNMKPKKFDPRARLNELKKNANMKGGAAFAAKIRSKAREAMAASRAQLLSAKTAYETKKAEDKIVSEVHQVVDNSPPKLSAVDLPGMSFITLFCDDQKVIEIRRVSHFILIRHYVHFTD